jgi:hypothetical protein
MWLEKPSSDHTGGDLMLDLAKVYAHCPSCDGKLRLFQSQPYSNRTWRIDFDCKNFECEWDGFHIEVEE